ncbi:dienelactone hydrolase (plasmid) [Legionella adelaidensis]|uniref:Dienelactone hydrolase n=1 Tax=Legionella adelaidensis TaxID=45056 RepID=A0A0W0R6B5_9GAMM|nr:dienelactone hydrolase family protein [Legionella adelaidensis]KTC66574.1 dienelactone hydrolase [Legionella adelaidensis]VEH85484.1 dienelactone hydrolase [Legionella adelaidensis]
MHKEEHNYKDEGRELKGFIAYDENKAAPMPGVLIVHDWTGCNAFARDKAEKIANLGYFGFAVDMFGNGKQGKTIEEKQALIQPLVHDRRLIRDRLIAAYESLLAFKNVDKNRIAIMGFCFGGLCALDMARSGINIQGAISFHGLLNRPEGLPTNPIRAKILVLHGYDDPMVPPDVVNEFCQEMTEAKADWQVHMYGNTQHAFTNPEAHDRDLGTIYNSLAAERSWRALENFLSEIFTINK